MNPIIDNLHTRKSVRAFEERPIPSDVREQILISATEAPTAGNQQLYTILDITDQQIKDHLAISCDNQPFIAKSPMVLVLLRGREEVGMMRIFSCGCDPRLPGRGDLMLAVQDAIIAAQNAVTAAWSFARRFLLHRGHDGKMRGTSGAFAPSQVRVPGDDGGFWLSHGSADRTEKARAL